MIRKAAGWIPENIALNKGRSDFDLRHTAVISWLWQSPTPQSRLARAIAGRVVDQRHRLFLLRPAGRERRRFKRDQHRQG